MTVSSGTLVFGLLDPYEIADEGGDKAGAALSFAGYRIGTYAYFYVLINTIFMWTYLAHGETFCMCCNRGRGQYFIATGGLFLLVSLIVTLSRLIPWVQMVNDDNNCPDAASKETADSILAASFCGSIREGPYLMALGALCVMLTAHVKAKIDDTEDRVELEINGEIENEEERIANSMILYCMFCFAENREELQLQQQEVELHHRIDDHTKRPGEDVDMEAKIARISVETLEAVSVLGMRADEDGDMARTLVADGVRRIEQLLALAVRAGNVPATVKHARVEQALLRGLLAVAPAVPGRGGARGRASSRRARSELRRRGSLVRGGAVAGRALLEQDLDEEIDEILVETLTTIAELEDGATEEDAALAAEVVEDGVRRLREVATMATAVQCVAAVVRAEEEIKTLLFVVADGASLRQARASSRRALRERGSSRWGGGGGDDDEDDGVFDGDDDGEKEEEEEEEEEEGSGGTPSQRASRKSKARFLAALASRRVSPSKRSKKKTSPSKGKGGSTRWGAVKAVRASTRGAGAASRRPAPAKGLRASPSRTRRSSLQRLQTAITSFRRSGRGGPNDGETAASADGTAAHRKKHGKKHLSRTESFARRAKMSEAEKEHRREERRSRRREQQASHRHSHHSHHGSKHHSHHGSKHHHGGSHRSSKHHHHGSHRSHRSKRNRGAHGTIALGEGARNTEVLDHAAALLEGGGEKQKSGASPPKSRMSSRRHTLHAAAAAARVMGSAVIAHHEHEKQEAQERHNKQEQQQRASSRRTSAARLHKALTAAGSASAIGKKHRGTHHVSAAQRMQNATQEEKVALRESRRSRRQEMKKRHSSHHHGSHRGSHHGGGSHRGSHHHKAGSSHHKKKKKKVKKTGSKGP